MLHTINQEQVELVSICVLKVNVNGSAGCAAQYLENTIQADSEKVGDPVWAPTVYSSRLLSTEYKNTECCNAHTANNEWLVTREFTPEEVTITLFRAGYKYSATK